MNEELKPCPTCGKPPIQFGVLNAYRCEKCAKNSGWMSEKDWNTRPIEDGLRGEIKTLKEWPRCHIHDCDMHKTTASEQPWICPECELRGELETANTLLVECANRLVKTDETVEDKFIGRLITHTARFLKADSIAHREGEVK